MIRKRSGNSVLLEIAKPYDAIVLFLIILTSSSLVILIFVQYTLILTPYFLNYTLSDIISVAKQ